MLLHWFKLCIHELTMTLFQLESVTYAIFQNLLMDFH